MQNITIQATTTSDKVEFGTAEVRIYSKQETMGKVIKTLCLYWGASLLSILIPVFHFVSVPLLFGLGIFFAVRARKYQAEIITGSINCPSCEKPVTLNKAAVIWPATEICQNCANVLRIYPKES